MALRPNIFADYVGLSRSGYEKMFLPAIGGILRSVFGSPLHNFWLQFVPPAVGLIWFAFYWHRHGANWNWREQMPLLVAVSLLTSVYGWALDGAILLIPIIAAACRLVAIEGRIPRWGTVLYNIVNVTALVTWIIEARLVGFLVLPLAVLFGLLRLRTLHTAAAFPANKLS
jgi:hypothetical protein